VLVADAGAGDLVAVHVRVLGVGGVDLAPADWEKQFTNALRMAHLTTKVGELKAELEKLPADRPEQLRRELEGEGDRKQ
jgi:hypothetical protein